MEILQHHEQRQWIKDEQITRAGSTGAHEQATVDDLRTSCRLPWAPLTNFEALHTRLPFHGSSEGGAAPPCFAS